MAATPRVKYPHITRDPRIHGGEPTIAGTRIPVRSVVIAWREYQDAPAVLAEYPRLTAETLAEALAYYEDHREELDEIIRVQLADE